MADSLRAFLLDSLIGLQVKHTGSANGDNDDDELCSYCVDNGKSIAKFNFIPLSPVVGAFVELPE